MILVESDAEGDWGEATDWTQLAERSAMAAVAASRFDGLVDAGLEVEISVKFTSDAEVRALNAAYRNKDKPTNVLSFPMIDASLLNSLTAVDGGQVLLGDVVLARGVCGREAEERNIPVDRHASHLIVHGVLHLLGYDHEQGDEDAELMEATERQALAAIGISDPYAISEVHDQQP
jgi:probable rRNA maturation factor